MLMSSFDPRSPVKKHRPTHGLTLLSSTILRHLLPELEPAPSNHGRRPHPLLFSWLYRVEKHPIKTTTFLFGSFVPRLHSYPYGAITPTSKPPGMTVTSLPYRMARRGNERNDRRKIHSYIFSNLRNGKT